MPPWQCIKMRHHRDAGSMAMTSAYIQGLRHEQCKGGICRRAKNVHPARRLRSVTPCNLHGVTLQSSLVSLLCNGMAQTPSSTPESWTILDTSCEAADHACCRDSQRGRTADVQAACQAVHGVWPQTSLSFKGHAPQDTPLGTSHTLCQEVPSTWTKKAWESVDRAYTTA